MEFWLLERGVGQQVVDQLRHGGCASLADLQLLDEEMLDSMHIHKPFDRRKLLLLVQRELVVPTSANVLEITEALQRAHILPESAGKYARQLATQGIDSLEKLAMVSSREDLFACGISALMDTRVILGLAREMAISTTPPPPPVVFATEERRRSNAAGSEASVAEHRRSTLSSLLGLSAITTGEEETTTTTTRAASLVVVVAASSKQEVEAPAASEEEEEEKRSSSPAPPPPAEEEDDAALPEPPPLPPTPPPPVAPTPVRTSPPRPAQPPLRLDGTCSYLDMPDVLDLLDEIALDAPSRFDSLADLVDYVRDVVLEFLPDGQPPTMLLDLSHMRVLCRWIARNMAVDCRVEEEEEQQAVDVDAVLQRGGKVGAWGLASLVHAAAKLLGDKLAPRIVRGLVKPSSSFRPGDPPRALHSHAWNVIHLGAKRKPFLIDMLMCAGTVAGDEDDNEGGGRYFLRQWQPHYFLCRSDWFAGDHFPLDAQDRLLLQPASYSLDQFCASPVVKPAYFASGMQRRLSDEGGGVVECELGKSADMTFTISSKWDITPRPRLRELGSGEVCERCPPCTVAVKGEEGPEEDVVECTFTIHPPPICGDFDLTFYVAPVAGGGGGAPSAWAVSYLFRVT